MMNQEQLKGQQKNQVIQHIPINQTSNISKQSSTSGHLLQYCQFLQVNKKEDEMRKIYLIKKLQKSGINYAEHQFTENIRITIVRNSFNYEILALSISYGCFQSQISIVNMNSQSHTFNLELVAEGNHGSIFKTCFNDRLVAIKCIEFDEDNFIETLKLSIKQYFILKIASGLGIGPQIINIYGFDLVIYRNSIQFSMQFCSPNLYLNNNHLKQQLHKLHLFNIIHFDVKPSNIGYSQISKSFVFLDYGLSKIIKEEIGHTTFANFNGTYQYSSQEMVKLFLNNQAGLVDLYYNDAVCLINSIQQMQSQNLQEQNKESQDNILHIGHRKVIDILNAKHMLYLINFELVLFDQTQLFRHRSTIKKFNLVMKDFIKYLPIPLVASLDIVSMIYGEKQSKERYKEIKESSLSRHSFENLKHNYHFIKRYNILNYINLRIPIQLFQQNTGKCEKNILSDEKLIASLKPSQYHLALINFIKINGKTLTFSQKKQVCQVFIKNIGKNIQFEDGQQLYKYCLRQILNVTLNLQKQETLNKFQILKSIMQTVIILQIVTEQQLRRIVQQIFKSNFIMVQKLSLILQILTSLEFTHQRTISTYNYYRLKEYVNLQFSLYLNHLQTKDTKYRLLINLFKVIMQNKNNMLQYYHKHVGQFYKFNLNYLQRSLVFTQIRLYMIYLLSYVSLINKKKINVEISQILFACLQNNYMNELYYYTFVTYYFNYINVKYQDCRYVFSSFKSQMGHLKQAKSFKMNLLNIYSKIYNKITQKSIHFQFYQHSQQQIEDQQQSYLIEAHRSIIDLNPNFHHHLYQLFDLSLLIGNQKYKQIVKDIIGYGFEKILNLKLDHKIKNDALHFNYFKRQISSLMKILFFLRNYSIKSQTEIISIYEGFGNSLEYKLSLVQCLQCKMQSLFQLKIEEIAFWFGINEKQNAISLLLQLIATFFKYPDLNVYLFRCLSMVMVIAIKNKSLFNRVNIIQLIYQWFNTHHLYEYSLLKYNDICSFWLIYVFIVQRYTIIQLAKFIAKLSYRLLYWNSALLVDSFQQSIALIIDEHKGKPSFNYFIGDHVQIISFLLKNHSDDKQTYLSLYFIVLLSIHFGHQINHKMISFIAKYIDYIDDHSKKKILRKYYGYYLAYFNMSKRKRSFITKFDIKNMQKTPKKVKNMLKTMNLKSLLKDDSIFIHKMLTKMQNYHKNIDFKE